MTWNMDDPRWTAYALGELSEADRAELDAVIEADPEARAYLESLRETIGAIEAELSAAPAPALDDLQRQRIQVAAKGGRSARRRWLAIAGAATGVAAAAAIAVTVIGSNSAKLDSNSSDRADDRLLSLGSASPSGPSPDRTIDLATKAGALGVRNGQGQGQAVNADPAMMPADSFKLMPGQAGTKDQDVRHDTEAYSRIDDNPFFRTRTDPVSTFSIDVDTASYSNLRRFLDNGSRPPKDAVRIEEMINYFHYDYPAPKGNEPFSITTEVGPAPWDRSHRLVRIGLRTPEVPDTQVPARNLVFLIDTSGSMQDADKLPLLVRSLGMLVENLRPQDRVALVTYAGAPGLVLDSTADKAAIRQALTQLDAGGSTNGGAGIELAYRVAERHFKKGGINRIVLCTDGDYNVGTTTEGALTRLIEREREGGVSLTVLGFGMGNLKDSTMEKLADRGNGNYAYIDSLFEARKVLVEEAGATLVTVAKDVKLQIELNPATVAGYRLIGYENRILRNQDFNDDTKDAGDIGAGRSVTALYEVVPAGVPVPSPKVDPLKYQTSTKPDVAAASGELMTIKIRYKAPDGNESKLLSRAVPGDAARTDLDDTSVDYRWAAAIAAFGMALRESPYRGNMSWSQIRALAAAAVGRDAAGYRKQAIALIDTASKLPKVDP